MDKEKHLRKALKDYENGKSRPEDIRRLVLWFERTGNDGEKKNITDEEVAALYETIKNSPRYRGHRIPAIRRLRSWRYAAAVAMLLFVSGVSFLLLQDNEMAELISPASTPSLAIEPWQNEVKLTLEDGRQLVLSDSILHKPQQIDGLTISRLPTGEICYEDDNYASLPRLHSISTPKASQVTVVLPDGSKVWLNAESKISFYTNMLQYGRTVSMEGEAYFEVAKQSGKPFIVKNKDSEIEVLGTKFNVRAYDNAQSVTALLEGSVALSSRSHKIVMNPHDIASVSKHGLIEILDDKDIAKHIAWTQGYFIFDGAPLHELAAEISRWYALDVHVPTHSMDTKIKGTISRTLSLDKLINILEYMGVSCEKKEDTLFIKSIKTKPMQ